jgi:hypothetical protein
MVGVREQPHRAGQRRGVPRAPVAAIGRTLAVLSVAGVLLPSPAAAQQPAAGFQAAEIIDHRGFGGPLPAATAEIPVKWRTEGGVDWDRATHCVANQVRLQWRASAPDDRQALELMHGFSWQIQGASIPTNPCPVLPLSTTRDFLQAVVQQRRQGARILEYRDRPDIAEAAARAAPPVQAGQLPVQQRQDAGQLFIAWQAGGQIYHEVLSATVAFTAMGSSVMGSTGMVLAQRAPAGQLNVALGDQFAKTLKINPHWMAMARESTGSAERRFSEDQRRRIASWHASEMARINAQGAADRAAIRADTAREVGRINAQTYANTQATNDRIHRRTMEGIGEYNTYRDSSGQQVRSSIHGGDRVLRNPDGTYTSTRDPYYRPPGSEELQRVR